MSISKVYLTLGSNIDPEANLVAALRLLGQTETLIACSSVYQTPPQGFAAQADFLNMAVAIQTSHSMASFKTDILGKIEQELKRVRDPQNKNAPRTIDLDIALWENSFQDSDIIRFGHVALPLAEIAPDYIHPDTGQSLAEIASQFDVSAFILRDDLKF